MSPGLRLDKSINTSLPFCFQLHLTLDPKILVVLPANNSNNRFGMPQRITEKTGIPTLTIEADLCDLRFYSEGQSITKIETFIEQLDSSKVFSR